MMSSCCHLHRSTVASLRALPIFLFLPHHLFQAERVVEALQCHPWPNLTMKSKMARASVSDVPHVSSETNTKPVATTKDKDNQHEEEILNSASDNATAYQPEDDADEDAYQAIGDEDDDENGASAHQPASTGNIQVVVLDLLFCFSQPLSLS